MTPEHPLASLVLAAGRGRRLRPPTDRIPKPALPVLDVPLAAHALAGALHAAPPTLVNLSHLAEEAARRILPWFEGAPLEVSVESVPPLGTAGTLAAAARRLAPRVLVVNADLVCDLDPADLLAAHRRNSAPATAVVAYVERGADLAGRGTATGFVDRRTDPDASGARFLGMAVYERSVIEGLPDGRPLGLGEAVLRPLAERGELALFEHDGYRRDVGTPQDLVAVSLDTLAGAVRSPFPAPGRTLQVAGGRAYVGPGADVAEAALGPGAVVLAGARVGPGVTVTAAVIGPDEEVAEDVSHALWWDGAPLPG